ncbi:phenylacetate--CoA ligase family protein [Xanthomarina spongicola]|uniref:Phenylacetate-CoA ligase n=1 Tax=Xanthomarina spongicola TaxID=570520 RepID=A0A316DIK8_9FLAO|nr:phenylacetate--CoA ligase family protein [Xanthomarina spongicola]PWK18011.1 phenylacetate-CoA ligase [Xanthomarina spongicola]
MALEDLLYPLLNTYHKLPFWVKNMVGYVYRCIPNQIRYGKFYKQYIERINFFQNSGNEKTIIAQQKLLLDSVNHAIRNIEFYNNYKEISNLEDFRRLPVITKDLINQNKTIFIDDKKNNLALKANTGGSSGNPFVFYIHKGKTRSKEKAHFDWYWSQFGYKSGMPIVMIRGKSLKNNEVFEYNSLDNKLIINSNSINKDTIAEIYDQIIKFKPKFIHAYPSSLLIFTKVCKAFTKLQSFDLDIKSVFLGSEGLTTDDFSLLENFYKANIVNWYGHSECLIHAGRQDKEGNFKFYPFYGFVELLDDNDNVISQPNQLGRIIATGFDNEVMPLIRYDTGDLGELSENNKVLDPSYTCLKNIQGRDKNFIYLSDDTAISLTSIIFGQHYKEFDYIKELQIEQYKKGVIIMSIVPLKTFGNEDMILFKKSLLKTVKENTLTIDMKIVKRTKKTPRGKHILLIQHLK